MCEMISECLDSEINYNLDFDGFNLSQFISV